MSMNPLSQKSYFSPYSIAIFRIVLGVGLIFHLVMIKWPGLDYFLQSGCFDIASMNRLLGSRNISVFHVIQQPFLIHVFFSITLISFICILLGIKSKWTSLVALFCLWNINQRAYMLNSGWDMYAMSALTFSVFLPLDLKWALRPSKYKRRILPGNQRLIGWLVLTQIACIYLVSALTKSHPTWLEGTAFYNVINDKLIMRGLSPWLLTKPALTTLLNYSTIILELLIGIMVLAYFRLPDAIKTGLSLFLFIFHLFIVLLIDVEPFIFYTSACALLLLPKAFWKRILNRYTETPNAQDQVFSLPHLYRVIVPICIGLIVLANLHTLTGMSYISKPLKKLKVRKVTSKIFPIPFEHASFLNQSWIFYSLTLPDMGCVRLVGYGRDGAANDILTSDSKNHFCHYNSYHEKKFLSLFRIYSLKKENKWVYDRWAECKIKSLLSDEEISELVRVEVIIAPQYESPAGTMVVGGFNLGDL